MWFMFGVLGTLVPVVYVWCSRDFSACGLCLVFSGLWCVWFMFGVLGTLVHVVYVWCSFGRTPEEGHFTFTGWRVNNK